MLKTDCGFENGDIAAIDCFLTGGNLSHRYGASHADQRIENWWSHFKWSFSAWVIDYFKQLVQDGIFVAGNVVHIEYTWYVYAVFLQHKLDEVKNEENLHTIRYTKGCQVSGITYLNQKDMHLSVISSEKPILLMYYNKGILKKSLNR